jgi:hypothetical protein
MQNILQNKLLTFYLNQEESVKSCLLTLRDIILSQDPEISHELKYGMPFFCYRRKMFCYLWVHKKSGQPYLGIVEGKRFDEPFLIQEDRSRMKIMVFDSNKDLPLQIIIDIIQKALQLYKSGEIKY